ncbi:hypothetical protein REIFOR_03046 [Reinekea forsetii]|jgi:hypothetical protein|uniref:Uncharacterized protein n=1 Tax=Reinekea forsetii TaxID=1336806 RepID=A0A2K8KTU2_9GAMM|nr:hypothetical protein REIFOR_03046 [Reinekea forsetii]
MLNIPTDRKMIHINSQFRNFITLRSYLKRTKKLSFLTVVSDSPETVKSTALTFSIPTLCIIKGPAPSPLLDNRT